MNEEEEKKDPEEELKEEKERYERQNQEAYDEVTKGNEELRRRAEEEQKRIDDILEDRPGETSIERRRRISRQMGRYYKGKKVLPPDADIQTEGNLKGQPKPEDIFGPNYNPKPRYLDDPKDDEENVNKFQGNLGASIAFEVGSNTLLDLFSFALPLQSGGSYFLNLLAQKIRDPSKDLNQLEAAAAASTSLIPGANQYAAFMKGVKPATRGTQLARQIGRGAAGANIETIGQKVGEGEEVTIEDLQTATTVGGLFGGLFGIAPDIFKGGGDLPKVFRNIRKRLDGGKELITPEGINLGQATPEFEPTSVFQIKKGSRKGIPNNPEESSALERAGQKNVFKSFKEDPRLGESDEALTAQYRALDAKYDAQTLGDTVDEALSNAEKRKIYGRKLQATDLDVIIQEEALNGNTIPPEKAQEYVDLVNDTRLGKKDRNNPSKRLRRNQKGYIGTMVYLNEVSLGVNPNTLGNTADVINHIAKEMGTDTIGLKRIIEGQGGEISFQTEGMKTPKKIRSLKELVEAYYLRLSRYRDIPAFEKGHVFAANNIIEDKNISSLTDFYNNLEPEISRSIREQVGDETIEKLIAAKGKLKNDDFFRSLVDGNRKRQNNQEPDKILADLLGTQYGLRESFLSFVFPERSLSNTIPIESKAAFAELYRKELLAEIKGLKADLKNSGQSSVGRAYIDQLKIDVARSVAKGMKDNELLNAIILVDDKINKRPMTQKGEALPTRDDPIKTDDDGVIRGDTPD